LPTLSSLTLDSSRELLVKDADGEVVIVLDQDGNLHLKGEYVEYDLF